MLINWFRDQDHLVYINGETQLAQLEKTLRFPGLQEAAEALRDNPNPEGYTIDHTGRQFPAETAQ